MSWWRDRVRCYSGRIEDSGGDLLIAPGPAAREWLLGADRDPELVKALAHGVRVLRCALPPPGGDDPIAYPGICAGDWYSVALEAAAGEGAATVLLPPLCHPEGDAGVAEGAMRSIRRGLARHPSIRRLLIVCAEETVAHRWRAALFAAGRPHPCPGIAGELMRVACTDGDGLILPERCYLDRTAGCYHSDEAIIYYQFREGDGQLRLEICEIAGPDRSGRHLLVEADGTSIVLPSACLRRMARSPLAPRIRHLRRGEDELGGHRRETPDEIRDQPGTDPANRRSVSSRNRLRS